MSCTADHAITLGSIGERMDLLIAQGRSFGPMLFQAFQVDPALLPWPADTEVPDSAWVPVDLTGSTIRGQIRKKPGDTAVVASLVVSITNPTEGRYQLSLPDETTDDIVAGTDYRRPESLYVWDLEILDPAGNIKPLYYGDVRVQRRVTRV
jgi:hypothetical protein